MAALSNSLNLFTQVKVVNANAALDLLKGITRFALLVEDYLLQMLIDNFGGPFLDAPAVLIVTTISEVHELLTSQLYLHVQGVEGLCHVKPGDTSLIHSIKAIVADNHSEDCPPRDVIQVLLELFLLDLCKLILSIRSCIISRVCREPLPLMLVNISLF